MDDTISKPVAISSLFSKYEGLLSVAPVKTRRSERGDLIDMFLLKLNPERVSKGYKPLSFAFVSKFFKDRKMDIPQIYAFYRDCERAKNFGSYFWWSCKIDRLKK